MLHDGRMAGDGCRTGEYIIQLVVREHMPDSLPDQVMTDEVKDCDLLRMTAT